jgi:hypothetical protein
VGKRHKGAYLSIRFRSATALNDLGLDAVNLLTPDTSLDFSLFDLRFGQLNCPKD